MSPKARSDPPTRGPQNGNGGAGGTEEFARLLRCSHIFSSAVREVLEEGILRDITPHPLTLPQFHLLKVMAFNGQHQVGEVADFLGVSPPAATKNIDKLERCGLMHREPSKGDRRATLLSVSAKGRRLVQRYEERKMERLSPMLEEFDGGEIETFAELLERFSVSLLKLETPENDFCLRCAAYIESGCPVGDVRGGCPFEKVRRARSEKSGATGSS